MPLYEYRCGKCGHTFEKIERVNASERKKCPKCGARAARMQSAAAIQFKGTGWYATDYGGKSSDGGSKKTETSAEPAKTEPGATPAKPEPVKESAAKKKKEKE
ncbi:MAG TPA: zinc ribbon domain-containing protein [Candidatus Acidoferrales bacterium]|nr:zinc ribbon domain-containing protein [Candidatus Acidoferrales bacterium]